LIIIASEYFMNRREPKMQTIDAHAFNNYLISNEVQSSPTMRARHPRSPFFDEGVLVRLASRPQCEPEARVPQPLSSPREWRLPSFPFIALVC
jgi:hypothetical protein